MQVTATTGDRAGCVRAGMASAFTARRGALLNLLGFGATFATVTAVIRQR
jgi:hypothetical protein